MVDNTGIDLASNDDDNDGKVAEELFVANKSAALDGFKFGNIVPAVDVG
jgi:hypothetical protein